MNVELLLVEHIIYIIALLLALTGLGFFLTSFLFWDWLGRFYQSWYCKGLSEIARFGSLTLGISSWSISLT